MFGISSIQLIQLRLESTFQLTENHLRLLHERSLQLEGRREETVLRSPLLGEDLKVHETLESLQSILLHQTGEILLHRGLQLAGLAQLLEALSLQSVLLRPNHHSAVLGDNHSHQERTQRVSVHEDLTHQRRLSVDDLQLLRSDVFSLRQLEEVLLAVDNLRITTPILPHLRRSVREHHRNIARVEEVVSIVRLLRQFGMTEVAGRNIVSLHMISLSHTYTQTQLSTTDARHAVVIAIRVEIVHIGNVLQTHVAGSQRSSHVSARVIVGKLQQGGTRSLRRSVALHDDVSDDASQEVQDDR